MKSTVPPSIARACVALVALSLAGCASLSPESGFGAVREAASARLGKDVAWTKTASESNAAAKRVAELLKNPLSLDDAVQIALLNNKGLQASFGELGISEADLVQAGRLPNPRFTLRNAHAGADYTIEKTLTFNVLSLLTMPMAGEMERRKFAATQRAVTMEILRLASDTAKAWIRAVSAEENVRYMNTVKDLADSSAELARRMEQVGNWNKLNRAREQGFYAEAALNLAKATRNQVATREKLTRLMGLWGADIQYRLPERLPDLPAAADDLPDVEQTAMSQRLDVQGMRLSTEATARNLGLTKATRFVNALEFGPTRILEGRKTDPYRKGYEVSLEIPIFGWSGGRVAKAEAIYMQSVDRLAEAAVNARSEVREAYQGYRISYDIARHYRDEIVPIKKRIAEENQLRYNGMIIGVFELLADARSQVASVNGYIEALRDFWLAKADLDMAMTGTPNMNPVTSGAIAPDTASGH